MSPFQQSCPEQLDSTHIKRMRENGYLAFDSVLTPEEVSQARQDIRELIRGHAVNRDLAKLEDGAGEGNCGGGWVRSRKSPFAYQFQAGYQPDLTDLDGLELQVRKLWSFQSETDLLSRLAGAHPRLKAIREAIVGSDPILFQSMALIKPPYIGTEKPWHQDNAYFSVTPLDAVLGVWIALDDATVANGCMHVLEGQHEMTPRRHHHTFDCEIMEGRLDAERARPVELRAGGAMFFFGMLPHQTPANASPDRRRALQFHYRSRSSQVVDEEVYNRVFKEADGTPASCAFARKHGGEGI